MASRQPAKYPRLTPALPLLLISVQEMPHQLVEAAREAGFKGVVTKSRRREVLQVSRQWCTTSCSFNGIDNRQLDAAAWFKITSLVDTQIARGRNHDEERLRSFATKGN
jgi:hypothetical protein